MATAYSVEVQVVSSSPRVPADQSVESWVSTVLSELDFSENVEVSVRIVDEDESQSLNKTYRDQDKPTNVLSFSTDTVDFLPTSEPRPLGDIVICAPVVEREAVEQGKALDNHWAHMVVHGTLHLLGFDHETDAQAMEMESLEREILASGGVPDPYLS